MSLLRRISARAVRGSLITGAALGTGCTTSDNRQQEMSPATSSDAATATDAALAPSEAGPDAVVTTEADAGSELTGDAAVMASDVPAGAVEYCARLPTGGFSVQASGLTPTRPVDYLAVRQANGPGRGLQEEDDAGVWADTRFTTLSEAGKACASASGPDCADKVARHPSSLFESQCLQACVEWSVVTTRGDDVQRYASPEELLTLLAPIDSADDALMLLASRGYDVACPFAENPIGQIATFSRYALAVPGGYEVIASGYADTCPVIVRRYKLFVAADGSTEVRETRDFRGPANTSVCVGRVPAGLKTRPRAGGDRFGEHLAQCAHLEAASVIAFERLADELLAHGAPALLVERARRAARDEVEHARVVGTLAVEQGGQVRAVQVDTLALRALEEIALENATEGCVRETYGALVGLFQAETAAEPALRLAMREIAEDELRHAALSHDVHAWLCTQLDEAAVSRVEQARERALTELAGECAYEPDAVLRQRAGLPSAQQATAMARALRSALFA